LYRWCRLSAAAAFAAAPAAAAAVTAAAAAVGSSSRLLVSLPFSRSAACISLLQLLLLSAG